MSGFFSGAGSVVLASRVTVDFNVANTDTAIPIVLPVGLTRYRIGITANVAGEISGASASISTATYGLFTATGGGGVAIVAAGQAIALTSASENTSNNMASVVGTTTGVISYNATTLYFRVGTAQGSAATATVIIFYTPVS